MGSWSGDQLPANDHFWIPHTFPKLLIYPPFHGCIMHIRSRLKQKCLQTSLCAVFSFQRISIILFERSSWDSAVYLEKFRMLGLALSLWLVNLSVSIRAHCTVLRQMNTPRTRQIVWLFIKCQEHWTLSMKDMQYEQFINLLLGSCCYFWILLGFAWALFKGTIKCHG